MEISPKHKEAIEKITAIFKCPKDFARCKSGFENLCKAKDGGMKDYINCLEENPRDCIFAIPYEYGNYCRCPLRVYIAKEMHL